MTDSFGMMTNSKLTHARRALRNAGFIFDQFRLFGIQPSSTVPTSGIFRAEALTRSMKFRCLSSSSDFFELGLNVIRNEADDDYGLPRTMTLDTLANEQYL